MRADVKHEEDTHNNKRGQSLVGSEVPHGVRRLCGAGCEEP